MQAQSEFEAWASNVREGVNKELRRFFESKRKQSVEVSPRSVQLVEAIEQLTMRGGKRLRPLVASAALAAVDDEANPASAFGLGASLELLQSYLLIHDDWMDQDDERRGGPSVHAAFRADHDAHTADSLAILAGDLASTWSWEVFLQCPFAARQTEAAGFFSLVQQEVIAGQQLDVVGDPDVDRMQQLKTGSYTVRGPAMLGCLIGAGSQELAAALERWALPLGVAFQLRDDLMGTFGDPKSTGKPGDDVRHGKHNAVIQAFQNADASESQRATVQEAFGRSLATDDDVHAALDALIDAGARQSVETKLTMLVSQAQQAISSAAFTTHGSALLQSVTNALTHRGH